MKKISKNKNKGFTLVELIAVMAILAILAAVIAPKAFGYIEKAKKTKIVQQCHTLVLAVDAYNADKADKDKTGTDKVSDAMSDLKADKLIEDKDVDKISGSKVSDCREVINGAEFDLGDKDVLGTVTPLPVE